jgi:hypothetical protein
MSAEKTSDDSQKRLGRLKAMQSKHQPVAAPAAAAAAPAKKGLMAALQGGGGGAGEGGIQAKLRKALTGPDGKIDKKKARMFVMMIRKQAADPAAPRHEMAKKIAEKIKSLPAQQRQKLMAMTGFGGSDDLGGPAMGGGRRHRRSLVRQPRRKALILRLRIAVPLHQSDGGPPYSGAKATSGEAAPPEPAA